MLVQDLPTTGVLLYSRAVSADLHGDGAGNDGSILLVICHQSLLRVPLRLLLVDVEVLAHDIASLQNS